MTSLLRHPKLGLIQGKLISSKLIRFHSLPYATIPQRFARSVLVTSLPQVTLFASPPNSGTSIYDATKIGPSSIQLPDPAKTDAKSNQLPTDGLVEQEQSEDCLRVTVTRPANLPRDTKLPVVVFIHGGAFFLGSGERAWLDPSTFCLHALELGKPVIFVSVNYRLGLLGFLHSPEASDLIPPNNGLHDQIRAFEWIQQNIAGFGGDPENITALGQSAGGESISLHNVSGQQQALYKKAITLSGTLVTMPAKTAEQSQDKFLESAGKIGIEMEGRQSEDIAKDMVSASLDKIKEANFVGGPCTQSELLPYGKPTMAVMRGGPESSVGWLKSHLVSSCTYDGSISYIMTTNDDSRKDHAAGFVKVAKDAMKSADDLFNLYGITSDLSDKEALEKICLFESDIGFLSAAVSQAIGTTKKDVKGYFQLFDLGNPFEGLLKQDTFASHTWDIVALLGRYEDRMTEQYRNVIRSWRERIIYYVVDGKAPCHEFTGIESLLVDQNGVGEVSIAQLPGAERRVRLWKIAESEHSENGLDFLWEGVCRRWLDQGS